jgi:type I restriction enzyme S subunit
VFASYLIRLRILGDVDPAYVAWFLRSPDYWRQVREAAAGIALLNVNAKKLAEIRIPLAPAPMQRRIVAAIEERLSRLDAAEVMLLRSKRRIESLRSLVITSLLDGDWPRVQWKEVGRSQNGRAFPSRDYSNEGVRLLRPGNLAASGQVVWTEQNTRRMPARYREQFPSYVVGPNELVMNLTAQSLKDEFLGRVCLTGPQEQCLLNQRLARLSPLDADVHYLLFVFKARPFRRFVGSLNKGSLIQHMFTSQLAEFEVPLPPLDEQRRIVADIERRLSIIDATTVAVEGALVRCSALRRAILQQAFTGRLVPQDPSDEADSALVDRIAPTRTSAPSSSRRRGRTLA